MHRRFLVALMYALTFFAQGVFAQNLLNNPDFDTNAGGWTSDTVGDSSLAVWTNTDGFPAPGSTLLVAMFTGEKATFKQCINMTSQSIDAFAYSKIHLFGGGLLNVGDLQILSFNAPNCVAYNSFQDATAVDAGNGWFRHTITNFSLPSTTQSVAVVLSYTKGDSSGGVFMDHVAFGPAGTVIPSEIVFKNDFET